MKKNGGITLIALVVTIIVLLILAGVSIAMLTGQNGILGNAQDSSTYNAYYGAEEQVKLAYMAVKTEIMAQVVKDGSYKPNQHASDLVKVVQQDLGDTTKWKIGAQNGANDAEGKIEITYIDSAIDQGKIGNRTYSMLDTTNWNNTVNNTISNAPTQEGKVTYIIHIGPAAHQTASLEIDGTTTTLSVPTN